MSEKMNGRVLWNEMFYAAAAVGLAPENLARLRYASWDAGTAGAAFAKTIVQGTFDEAMRRMARQGRVNDILLARKALNDPTVAKRESLQTVVFSENLKHDVLAIFLKEKNDYRSAREWALSLGNLPFSIPESNYLGSGLGDKMLRAAMKNGDNVLVMDILTKNRETITREVPDTTDNASILDRLLTGLMSMHANPNARLYANWFVDMGASLSTVQWHVREMEWTGKDRLMEYKDEKRPGGIDFQRKDMGDYIRKLVRKRDSIPSRLKRAFSLVTSATYRQKKREKVLKFTYRPAMV